MLGDSEFPTISYSKRVRMTGLLPRETPSYWYRFAGLPGLTTRPSQTLSLCSSAQIIRTVRYCRARQDVS